MRRGNRNGVGAANREGSLVLRSVVPGSIYDPPPSVSTANTSYMLARKPELKNE